MSVPSHERPAPAHSVERTETADPVEPAETAQPAETADSRPVAVLLHGQPGSARDWARVRDSVGGGVRTLAIDRPGWDGRTRAGDLRASGEAAIEALDAAGVRTATIVGLSYGGAVAAWLAIHHPERVGALVLVSPAANRDALELLDRIMGTPIVGYAVSVGLLSLTGFAFSSRKVRQRLEANFALPDDYLLATGRRLLRRSTWDAFIVEQRALLRDVPELEPRLGEIVAPTTIVIGTADTVVPVASGRKLARQIRDAELIEIEDGHHTLPAEHPERLAEVILAAAGAD